MKEPSKNNGTSQKRTRLYRFLQVVIGFLVHRYFGHETFGLQYVPENEGAIIATNHASILDPVLIGVDLPRPLFIMAKQSLHEIPLFGELIRTLHSFPVKRGSGDRNAIRKAINIVNRGNLVLLFIEGTRTRDGSLQKPRPGIGKIVEETNQPVIPGYVSGSFQALRPGAIFPRPCKTRMDFGPPLEFDRSYDLEESRSGRRRYQSIADEIMDRIRDLKRMSKDLK